VQDIKEKPIAACAEAKSCVMDRSRLLHARVAELADALDSGFQNHRFSCPSLPFVALHKSIEFIGRN